MYSLFVATLVGWGNSEADQRKAFIASLQDINNRPGAHVLVPNANDEKAFDFIAQLIKLGPNPAPRTIEQIAATPSDLTAAKDGLDKMTQGIETRLAKINADRAALKQPGDLKAVYDKTFDKLVTAPAVAMENSAKALDTGIDAALARHLHQRAPRKARRLRHADPGQGSAHVG